MNETIEIPEGQHNEAGQGATNVQEDKGKPLLPPSVGNTGKKNIYCLGSFHCYSRATYNYCGTTYACDTKLNGTTTMRNHIQSQCYKYSYREDQKKKSNQL